MVNNFDGFIHGGFFNKISFLKDSLNVPDIVPYKKCFSRFITYSGNRIVQEYHGNIILRFEIIVDKHGNRRKMFDKRLITILETYDKTLNPFSKNL